MEVNFVLEVAFDFKVIFDCSLVHIKMVEKVIESTQKTFSTITNLIYQLIHSPKADLITSES